MGGGAPGVRRAVQNREKLTAAISEVTACNVSGSFTIAAPVDVAAPGTTFTIDFTNCVDVAGLMANGRMNGVVKTANAAGDATSYTLSWTDFRLSGSSVVGGSVTISGAASCTVDSKGDAACTYSDSGARAWGTATTYTNGVLNGTYTGNYGGGVVTVKYTNFSASSGTAEFTGANGSKVLITRNSATKFTVVVTVGGVSSTYVFGA